MQDIEQKRKRIEAVAIDLVGNNINKQQAMVLCKMVIFAAVIPMNAD